MFYYTNFIVETNVWWLRRVRPIWMGAAAIISYYYFHRYYFFGKEAAKTRRSLTPERAQQLAQINKRHFGFVRPKPTLARSRRKQIMEVMGEHYDPACELEDTYLLTRDFAEYEAQLVEENDY